MIKEEYKNLPDTEFVPLKEGIDPVFWGLYEINKLGELKNIKLNKILKPSPHPSGYLRFSLTTCIDKKVIQQTVLIHRLIAFQFLFNDDPQNKIVVDHIDRNKLNNSITNLRFVSIKENNKNRSCSKPGELMYIALREDNSEIFEYDPTDNNQYSVDCIHTVIRENRTYKGFYWACISKDALSLLRGLGKTLKDINFIESTIYPNISCSIEGFIKYGARIILGSINGLYRSIRIEGKSYLAHRVIYETCSGKSIKPGNVIDHINTNPNDNSFSNLRECSQKENMSNPITKIKLSKSIALYNSSGDIIKRYESIKIASKELRLSPTTIRRYITESIKTVDNFIIKYETGE